MVMILTQFRSANIDRKIRQRLKFADNHMGLKHSKPNVLWRNRKVRERNVIWIRRCKKMEVLNPSHNGVGREENFSGKLSVN